MTRNKLMAPCFTDFVQFSVHLHGFNNSITMLSLHNPPHIYRPTHAWHMSSITSLKVTEAIYVSVVKER